MKTILISVKMLVVMTLLSGVIYPLSVMLVSNIFFHNKANGSIIYQDGKAVGSALIAQDFKQDKYFWPRPSAGDYATMSSAASNLTPTGEEVKENMKSYAAYYANSSGKVADEMLFTSASGLDPHISPQAAYEQSARIAKERAISIESVEKLIRKHTQKRSFGVLGQERVNVLKLNLDLDGTK